MFFSNLASDLEVCHLVGGKLPFFIFPYIGLLIIPIDVHIFLRGGYTTTNQSCFVCWLNHA